MTTLLQRSLGALTLSAILVSGLHPLLPAGQPILYLGLWLLLGIKAWLLWPHIIKSEDTAPEPAAVAAQPAKSWLIDSSALIDGRLPALRRCGLLSGSWLIPRLVLDELQFLSDRGDRNRRDRGRRGLDLAAELKTLIGAELSILEAEKGEKAVDERLLELCLERGSTLVSVDKGLLDRARVEGCAVLSLHELAQAMQLSVLPGQQFRLKIVRRGESKKQGVAYLDDGTMVIVEGGRAFVGEEQDIVVQSMIKTRNGPLIFAKLDPETDKDKDSDHDSAPESPQ